MGVAGNTDFEEWVPLLHRLFILGGINPLPARDRDDPGTMKIPLIKAVRGIFSCGLKEAEDLVDAYIFNYPAWSVKEEHDGRFTDAVNEMSAESMELQDTVQALQTKLGEADARVDATIDGYTHYLVQTGFRLVDDATIYAKLEGVFGITEVDIQERVCKTLRKRYPTS